MDAPEVTAEAPPRLTYPDAPWGVIDRWNGRRGPVLYGKGESLPPLDTDLRPLLLARVPEASELPATPQSHYKRKLSQLRSELAGQSELAVLNADVIVHLRREVFPPHAPALFLRIWKEEGRALMQDLPSRWLISSINTFADFGETEAQRRIGMAMNVLFSLMKLYEFERLMSGKGGDETFRAKRKKGSRLPLGMLDFGIDSGGLDYNLLAPIWKDALAEPVAGPLACLLLDRLNADPSNLFRRLQRMRDGRRAYLLRMEARARAQEAAEAGAEAGAEAAAEGPTDPAATDPDPGS